MKGTVAGKITGHIETQTDPVSTDVTERRAQYIPNGWDGTFNKLVLSFFDIKKKVKTR